MKKDGEHMMTTQYTLEDLREIAYRGSYDDMQRSLARTLLAAYEQKPFMYGIADPDGKAHIDEYCFCAEPAPLEDSVDELNDYREADDELNYAVVPLYLHPAPSIPAVMPEDADPRDAFERVFPIPKHAIRCGKGYACTEYNAWDAHKFVGRWDGWNACHAAMLNGGKS